MKYTQQILGRTQSLGNNRPTTRRPSGATHPMEKPMKHSDYTRTIGIVERHNRIRSLLEANISFNASTISAEFEISTKTFYRDIAYLRKTGIKIIYDEKAKVYLKGKE